MFHKDNIFQNAKKKFPSTLIKDALYSHHPTCDEYSHHIVRLFGNYFCLGCTFFYTGFFVSTILFLIFSRIRVRSWIEMGIIWGIGFILFLSFLPQLKMKKILKRFKVVKMLFRFNLGFGSSLLILSVMVKAPADYIGIILRCASILLYYSMYRLFFKLRARHKEEYCLNCSKGKYPFCSHNYKQIVDTIAYLKEKNLEDSFLYDFLTKLEIQIREPERKMKLVEFIVE